jgi:phosphohistidine phosphatase SixA
MKSLSLFGLLLCIALWTSCQESKDHNFQFDIPEGEEPMLTTYYFVRHAEKDTTDSQNKDPQLTEEGIRRANYLATYFADKKLDLFYSTDYSRTIQTLIPTIHRYKGDILSYEVRKDSLFTKEFWKTTYGKNVLVVGHSNTSPRFVNEIISESKYENLDENTYDVFFQVIIDENLKVKDSLITKKVPSDFNYNQEL